MNVCASEGEGTIPALELRPLDAAFGAEVVAMDFTSDDRALAARIEAAIADYGLLLFRRADLDDGGLARFAGRFGPVQNLSTSRDAFNPVVRVSNLTEDGTMRTVDDDIRRRTDANLLWHIDSTWAIPGATFTMLHARIVPGSGGDTEFCDTRLAWDALSPDRRASIADLVAVHSAFHARRLIGVETPGTDRLLPPIRRKLVRRHPPSGRDALIIASHIEAVEGLDYAEGRKLVDELAAFAAVPERVYRHRWAPGDLLMWDNRCVMHRATPYAEFDEPRDLRSARVDDVDDEAEVAA